MEITGFEIVSAEEMLPDEGLCIAIYGSPGVGKTLRCAEASKSDFGKPLLLVDAEAGAKTVRGMPDVDVMKITDFNKLVQFSQKFFLLAQPPYKTVMFDNLSEYQNLSLRAIVGSAQPQIQHYQESTRNLSIFVRNWRDYAVRTSVNIIFIAWDAPEVDAYAGFIKRDVGFTPTFARQFPGMIDIVGFMESSGSGKRTLSFAAEPRTAAKFRKSKYDAVANKIPLKFGFDLDDAPIADILNTLRGGMEFPTKYFKKSEEKKEE